MIFGDEDEDFDEDMAELFQEFVEDGNERFAAIKGASFPEQKELIAKESHKLKGSASNFGFARVSGLLAHIEDDIASLTLDDFETSLRQANRLFEESVQSVMARYPALASGCN